MNETRTATGFREGLTLIWTSSTMFSRIIGIILIVFAIFSGIQAKAISDDQRELQECQMAFVSAIQESLEVRSKATTETQDAVDNLFVKLQQELDEGGDPSDLSDAFAEYREVRTKAQAVRENVRYPEVSVLEECAD